MPAPQRFDVNFHDDRLIFFPGDDVSGQIEVELNEAIDVKEINIRFVGKAHTAWAEGGQYKIHVSGNKTYFTRITTVTIPDGKLAQGEHSFPFHYHLPNNLPTSYEDQFGHVRYYVRVTLIRPGLSRNQNIKVVFTVLKVHDLNAMKRNMLNPSRGSNNTTFCGLCCESGLLQCDLQLDRTGYVPGEWVIASGKLNNRSRFSVEKITIEILQIVTYVAQISTRVEKRSLVKERGPGIRGAQALNLSGVKLRIPATAPTESDCPIIKIKYAVMLTAHLPWWTPNLRTYVQFTIGTVPHNDLPLYSSLKDTSPSPFTERGSTPPKYEPPPPSYEDAVTGGIFDGEDDEDDDQTIGIIPYRPRYTFYDWDEGMFNSSVHDDETD